jgi:hypothetical protein
MNRIIDFVFMIPKIYIPLLGVVCDYVRAIGGLSP